MEGAAASLARGRHRCPGPEDPALSPEQLLLLFFLLSSSGTAEGGLGRRNKGQDLRAAAWCLGIRAERRVSWEVSFPVSHAVPQEGCAGAGPRADPLEAMPSREQPAFALQHLSHPGLLRAASVFPQLPPPPRSVPEAAGPWEGDGHPQGGLGTLAGRSLCHLPSLPSLLSMAAPPHTGSREDFLPLPPSPRRKARVP